jgi:hypothetical protein
MLPVEVLLRLQPRRLLLQSLHLQCAFDARIPPAGCTSTWSAVEAMSA